MSRSSCRWHARQPHVRQPRRRAWAWPPRWALFYRPTLLRVGEKRLRPTGAERWRFGGIDASFAGSVVADHLYFFDKIAVCFNKQTGDEKHRKRMPSGSTSVGS